MQSKQGLYGSMIPWIHEIRLRPTPPAQLIAVVRISAAHEPQSMKKNLLHISFQNSTNTQWARKFKKVQAKKKHVKSNKSKQFFRKIAFLAVLNFFPFQKLIFGHF